MINYYYITEDRTIKKCGNQRSEYLLIKTPRIITFDMVPIAQQRPRTRVVQPKGGGKAYAQIYTVNSKHKEKLLQMVVKQSIFEEATFAYALACYTPPKSWSQTKKEKAYGTHKVTKPDGTNILKFYEDLLEGLFMPKDQYLNPTMIERLYSTTNMIAFVTVPTRYVTYNIPKIVKEYFLGTLILE